jgi:hypothetical protein
MRASALVALRFFGPLCLSLYLLLSARLVRLSGQGRADLEVNDFAHRTSLSVLVAGDHRLRVAPPACRGNVLQREMSALCRPFLPESVPRCAGRFFDLRDLEGSPHSRHAAIMPALGVVSPSKSAPQRLEPPGTATSRRSARFDRIEKGAHRGPGTNCQRARTAAITSDSPGSTGV